VDRRRGESAGFGGCCTEQHDGSAGGGGWRGSGLAKEKEGIEKERGGGGRRGWRLALEVAGGRSSGMTRAMANGGGKVPQKRSGGVGEERGGCRNEDARGRRAAERKT
jgi:hypothetical protein